MLVGLSMFAKFAVAIFLLLSLLGPAHASGRELVAVTLAAPPMVYADEEGRADGALVEVVRQMLLQAGFVPKIKVVPWQRGIEMACHGDADAIFYAVKTSERDRYLRFMAEPLWVERTVAVVRRGEGVIFDSSGRGGDALRLGVGRGYYYGPRIMRTLEQGAFRKVEPVASSPTNLFKLGLNRIDAFLIDYESSLRLIDQYGLHETVEVMCGCDSRPVVLDSIPTYLALSRLSISEVEADELQRILREMKSSGEYRAILRRYGLDFE